MSPTSSAQLAFTAEFAVFLVALAGLACAIRPGLLARPPWARSSLASGFLALATAAFLGGSLILDDQRTRVLVGIRIAAAVLLAAGAARWTGARGKVAVWAGVAALAGAEVAVRSERAELAALLRLLAALLVGAALVFAARRSISARIGVDAAVLLLVVVLGVSVTVSFVVARNVEDEATRRYAARAVNEAENAERAARAALTPARLVAGTLAAARVSQLEAFSDPATASLRSGARAVLTDALVELTDDRLLAIADPVLFVSADGAPEAAVPRALDNTTRLGLAGDPVVIEALRARASRQAVAVVRRKAYAIGAAPVFVRTSGRPEQFSGLVVVARRFDATYLRLLGRAGEPLSFALATPADVLASAGRQPSIRVLRSTGRKVVDSDVTPAGEVGDRFVAAAPVAAADQPPVMAFVVSVPTSTINATREALFRTLFVVALAAALVALALAAFVGERIGGGLRRLTRAAERLQRGDFDAPAGTHSDDELGVLGSTFETMAGSVRDMTGELRQAAADESRLRARLEAVVAGMGEALVAMDGSGRVVEWNRAAEDLLGVERREAVGRPVGDLLRVVRADGSTVAVSVASLQAEGAGATPELALPPYRTDRASHVSEVDLVGPEGAPVPVVLTAGSLRGSSGEPAGAVLVARDVRREREVDSMKTDFLANISHELRSPLTPIKGYASVLARREVPFPTAREYASQISGGVEQLERVIGQLVNFATMGAGRLNLQSEPVPARDLVEAAAVRWAGRLDDSHHLSVSADDRVGSLAVDRTYLDQALDELIDNAVKYSPSGGPVSVTIGFGSITADAANGDGAASASGAVRASGGSASDARSIVIAVSDEGVGIAADRLAGLVEGFAQGDRSATRRFGGLGLGLALTDRIVRAHGGSLQFASTLGVGTRVSIVLPTHHSGNGLSAGASQPVDVGEGSGTAHGRAVP